MENAPQVLKSNFFYDLLIGRRYKILRHALCLLIVIWLVVYDNGRSIFIQPYDAFFKVIIFISLVSLFYINMYLLVPRYLLQNKFLFYSLFILGYIFIAYTSLTSVAKQFEPYMTAREKEQNNDPGIFVFIIFQVILTAASTAIKLFQRWIADTEKINELEKITIRSELEQLRNQLTPHFLFNMLNNANVLTQKDPEKASEVLMKLSDILRYQLYDSARQQVLLTAEIHFLNDFLNLEKVRRDNFTFIISKEGELSGIQVAPMLFITFVENAVKHNGDPENKSYVHVYFYVTGNKLTFKCINSKPAEAYLKNRVGGLGLANIKRRLELLYPDRHDLTLKEETEVYSVILNIDL
ncbi:sensor histidine kinase [Chitinophagaceae bacterium LWZ2-11]